MTTDRQDPSATNEPSGDPQRKEAASAPLARTIGDGIERLTRRLPSSRTRRPRLNRAVRVDAPRERIDDLIVALGDPQHPHYAGAVDELTAIGPAAVPALSAAIGPSQPWLGVYRAAEAAGRIGDGRSANALMNALRHPNSNVRWSAVRALTQVGDVRAALELRRIAAGDQGRTSWGESVAGAAQSALDEMRRRSVWGQGIELIKTSLTAVFMILALTLAFSVVQTVREELAVFGRVIPGQTQIPQFTLPTTAPTSAPTARPTAAAAVPALAPTAEGAEADAAAVLTEPTPGAAVLIGTVQQVANVRPLPNTDNQPIGQVNQGDEVLILARSPNGQWLRIALGERRAGASAINNSDGSGTGWINQALVNVPPGDIPVEATAPSTSP
jgi:hypothetical protein